MRTAIPFLHIPPVAGALRASRRLGSRAAAWLQGSIRAWAQTQRHRREVALLRHFDERMLRDVGLTRADVEGAASTPFWRDPAAILEGRAGPRGQEGRSAVPAAPSIVPGLPERRRDLAHCASPQTPALPALRRAGRGT